MSTALLWEVVCWFAIFFFVDMEGSVRWGRNIDELWEIAEWVNIPWWFLSSVPLPERSASAPGLSCQGWWWLIVPFAAPGLDLLFLFSVVQKSFFPNRRSFPSFPAQSPHWSYKCSTSSGITEPLAASKREGGLEEPGSICSPGNREEPHWFWRQRENGAGMQQG